MSVDTWDLNPNNPTLEKELNNTCGYCGEPCEKDYCNEDHYKARDN